MSRGWAQQAIAATSREPSRRPARFFRTLHAQKLGRVTLGCPLLLVHPGADAWTPTALSLEVYDRIESEKAFIELANGSHLPLEAPAADQLQSAVHAFLDRVAEAEAGGPACV